MKILYNSLTKSLLLLTLTVSPPLLGTPAHGQNTRTESRTPAKVSIRGVVRDKAGEPLVGATIVGEDGSGAVAGADGSFQLLMSDPSKPVTVRFRGLL